MATARRVARLPLLAVLVSVSCVYAGCGDDGAAGSPLSAEGEPCAASSECASKRCVDSGSGDGARCARTCAEPDDCAASQRCLPRKVRALDDDGVAASEALQLLCVSAPSTIGPLHLAESCAQDDDCASGLCGPAGRCTRPCGAAGCTAPLFCREQTLSREGLKRPEGARAIQIALDDTDDLRVTISRLEAPDGTVLVSYADPPSALLRAFDDLGVATVLIPESALQSGSYKLWVQTHEPVFDALKPVAGAIESVQLLWRADAQRGGLIDLDLYFSPGSGVEAAKAKDDPYVVDALTETRRLLEELAGLSIGEVRYLDLPASADAVADAAAVRGLRVAHVQHAGPRGLSVPILVIKDISFGFKGLAGAIPGVPGLVGRPASGIVVEAQGQAKRMGRLLAHELGHYLGLWHTTEKGAVGYDKLDDTPECIAGTKVANCPDRQNLMFPWYIDRPDPLHLSPLQAGVLRAATFAYLPSYPEGCGVEAAPVAALSASGFGGGSTAGLSDALSGSCGGVGAGERAHLLRLAKSDAARLTVEVVASGFAPAVYLRRGACADAAPAAEAACEAGKADEALTLTIDNPAAGAYYVVVDGASAGAGGDYRLRVTVE